VEALTAQIEAVLVGGLPALGTWVGGLPVVGPWVRGWLGDAEFDLLGLAGLLRPYAGTITQQTVTVLLAVLSGLAELLLAILLAFFFYRDGPAMARRVSALMEKLGGATGIRMLHLAADVTRGVVWGLLGTALAQGVLTAIGLAVAGVPQPVLLAVVAGVISIFPIGAPLVWIPASLWLFMQGQTGWGIFMALYGGLVISSVDNFIRPWAIARGANLPLLLTILGALGGRVRLRLPGAVPGAGRAGGRIYPVAGIRRRRAGWRRRPFPAAGGRRIGAGFRGPWDGAARQQGVQWDAEAAVGSRAGHRPGRGNGGGAHGALGRLGRSEHDGSAQPECRHRDHGAPADL
jgi:hypothetical protein